MTVTVSPARRTRPDPSRAPVPGGRRPRRRRGAGRALTYLVLLGSAALTVMPFVWMLLGSLKDDRELLVHPARWLPEHPSLDNYRFWFTDLHLGTYFTNSLVVAGVTVVGNLVFCSLVGYALAKLDFPGKRALFTVVMTTIMVPGIVTMIPLFVIVARLHLVNTYPGLILPFLTSPIGVFLMRQFLAGIPDELLEAARIDGAGELRIFARIVLPLCGPPLATLAVLTFLSSWNNFLWPLVVAQQQDRYTLPVALSLYSTGEKATQYGLLLAGSVLVITPIVVLFVVLQRWFVQGIASTGIK